MSRNRLPRTEPGPAPHRDRVVVAVTGQPANPQLVARAAAIAERCGGELVGVHVVDGSGRRGPAKATLGECRRLVAEAGGRFHDVVGSDTAQAIVAFARAEKATQLVVGASAPAHWAQRMVGASLPEQLGRRCPEVHLHVLATPGEAPTRLPRPRRHRPNLSVRRRLTGWAVVACGLPAVTGAGAGVRAEVGATTPILAYLLVVLAASALGGASPGLAAAVAAALLANWYFIPPLHHWQVNKTEDVVALLAFAAVAGVVAAFAGANARRTEDAHRARAEAEALARSTALLVGDPDPLPALLAHLRATFSLDRATVEVAADGGWSAVDEDGETADDGPGHPSAGEPGSLVLNLAPDTRLRLDGPILTADDHRLLHVFGSQLHNALAARELRREAARIALLDQANALRTALLQSVSHDLRSPLASIKAGVTSLLQDDIDWGEQLSHQFLHTIAAETDRLDRLIGNLLDMSRVQSGTVEATSGAVDLMDVTSVSLAQLGPAGAGVAVDIPDEIPLVLADPTLLERVLVNLLSNAVTWSAPDQSVRVVAAADGDEVELTVVDHGPGIPPGDRERVFEPFQRQGDRSIQAGVGLGLAVARSFTTVMGGRIDLDETPGGGLTVRLVLPAAAP